MAEISEYGCQLETLPGSCREFTLKHFLNRLLPGYDVPGGWKTVAVCGEYQTDDDISDNGNQNARKITCSMANCMLEDPRRRFVFRFTIENTEMRLWSRKRCEILASQPLNFITDRSTSSSPLFLSYPPGNDISIGNIVAGDEQSRPADFEFAKRASDEDDLDIGTDCFKAYEIDSECYSFVPRPPERSLKPLENR